MFPKERSGLYKGHTHIPPLEGGQQEVWPDVPESSRCQGIRPGGEEGAGGPDGRSKCLTVSMIVVWEGRVNTCDHMSGCCVVASE